MHMASSSAPHRTRPGDVGLRAHSQVHLFHGDSAPSSVQMAWEAKHKCCVKEDEFILTFTENVL